jgi:serine/threonine protein kinase
MCRSFGEVQLAEDLSTGELVALKFVRMLSRREGGGIPKAVFRELESLRQLQDHHRIVTLRESFPHDMELVIVFGKPNRN